METKISSKQEILRFYKSRVSNKNPQGFFDGSSKETMGYVGHVLFIETYHCLRYVGFGINNKDEFYAHWILLKTAFDECIAQLQVHVDSKWVIACAIQKFKLHNLELTLILNKLKRSKSFLLFYLLLIFIKKSITMHIAYRRIASYHRVIPFLKNSSGIGLSIYQ